jgi:hypothetical protein
MQNLFRSHSRPVWIQAFSTWKKRKMNNLNSCKMLLVPVMFISGLINKNIKEKETSNSLSPVNDKIV